MLKATCGICRRDRIRKHCEIIVLRDDEKAAIVAAGGTPEAEYVYCRPCWRAMSDRQTATAIMKGFVQTHLQQRGRGVGNAERMAKKFEEGLLAATQAKSEPKP